MLFRSIIIIIIMVIVIMIMTNRNKKSERLGKDYNSPYKIMIIIIIYGEELNYIFFISTSDMYVPLYWNHQAVGIEPWLVSGY